MILNKTLGEIATIIGGRLEGDATLKIHRLMPLEDSTKDDVSFLARGQYVPVAKSTRAKALIVSRAIPFQASHVIWVENASRAVSLLCENNAPSLYAPKTVHQTAIIGSNCRLDKTVSVGPHVVIGNNVTIGANTTVHASSFIGDNVVVGDNTCLYPGVNIYAHTIIGDSVVIHSGAVIGADGFGYEDGKKIAQVGIVRIGNNVEIGANTCIDRARIGETRIGTNTKIDNLVQIGHGTSIGRDCIICGSTGISGSVRIGNRVVIGGACAIRDHVRIVDDVLIGIRSLVERDIEMPGKYLGCGPLPAMLEKRCQTIYNKLPSVYRDLYRHVSKDS